MRATAFTFAALLVAGTSSAQSAAPGIARQVTASYTMDMAPAPDGERAVLIRVIAGREQLFLRQLGDGSEQQITTGDADHEDPAWSPDGRRIVFVLIKDGHKVAHLIDPDGSHDEAITPVTQGVIHPSFTPDGKALLYCTDDDLRPPAKNASQVYSIDLATRKVTTLISGGVNTFPVMSPDGTQIAFRRIVGDMNSEVFVADADGRNAKNLTHHWSFEGWPAWSPDGRTIAYAGNRNNAGYQVFLMDADGAHVRLLANTEGRGTAPKWSADGKTVYFTICRRSQDHQGCDIYSAPVAGATPVE